jgi:hypothetical protein
MPNIRGILLAGPLVGCLLGALSSSSQTLFPAPGARERTSSASVVTNPPLKSIALGVFQIGEVRFNQNTKEIIFSGTINMDKGVIEYALVHSAGKVHESLLRTDVEPYHVHLAALLLATNAPGSKSDFHLPRELTGDPVSVQIDWTSGHEERSFRVEDLIFNTQTSSAMSRGEWIYNGSRVVDGAFIAQREGSIISVISDPDALINNPRPGRENDEIWQVNSEKTPPVGTPVKITIHLEKSAEK